MAGPMAGVSAAQIAQQKLQDQGAQQVNKQGASKFDAALANKAQVWPEQAHQAQCRPRPRRPAGHPEGASRSRVTVEAVNKTEKAGLNKVNGANSEQLPRKAPEAVDAKPETEQGQQHGRHVVTSLEKGQMNLEKLINAGMCGKNFSNARAAVAPGLHVQVHPGAGPDLKVVEKATSGLKDAVKTQV